MRKYLWNFNAENLNDKKKIKIEVKPSDIVIPRNVKTILEVALWNHKIYLKDKLVFSIRTNLKENTNSALNWCFLIQ